VTLPTLSGRPFSGDYDLLSMSLNELSSVRVTSLYDFVAVVTETKALMAVHAELSLLTLERWKREGHRVEVTFVYLSTHEKALGLFFIHERLTD